MLTTDRGHGESFDALRQLTFTELAAPTSPFDRVPRCERCGAAPDTLDFTDSGGFLCKRCTALVLAEPSAADLKRPPVRLAGRRAAMATGYLETKSE